MDTVVNVPTASYRGVSLRASGARSSYEIVLMHVDPSLDVVLARMGDDAEVIARWRGFGCMLELPLLVEDEEGRLQLIDDSQPFASSSRRGGSALKDRRPRFLARRRVGETDSRPVHSGEREMFATAC
jgi:hypothetical protein